LALKKGHKSPNHTLSFVKEIRKVAPRGAVKGNMAKGEGAAVI
jgi:hypothetical protein